MLCSLINTSNPFFTYCDTIYDASNPNKNSASIPNDGDALASIKDTGKNGNDMVQSTVGLKPIYKTNIINGLNVFRFDGATQYMSCADSASNADNGTLLSIIVLAIATVGQAGRVIGKSDLTTGWGYGRAPTGRQNFNGPGFSYNSTVSGFVANVWKVGMMIRKADTSVDYYINGSFTQNITLTGTRATTTAPLTFGAASSIATFWPGDIQILGISWREWNAGEIAALNTAAKARGGL